MSNYDGYFGFLLAKRGWQMYNIYRGGAIMNIGIFNFLQFNSLNTTLLIMDKATDTY